MINRTTSVGLRNRDGQALLVAVLLMTVILLIGILFAALVSYNQGQSSRHVDMVAAQQSAEGGVNYANNMLQQSPQGADWRPHFVPYTGTGTQVQTDITTWPQDPALWPSPPAMYAADGSVDYNFWGVDGVEGTEDDYYSDFDIIRGWFPLRDGDRTAPGAFLRLGFNRYPDPNQFGAVRDNEQFGRGYFLLQVDYDPDPPYEPGETASQDHMSNCIKIVAIGRAVQDSNVFRRVVAYKPIGLTDHMLWITNQSGGARQATVAVRPNVDLDASGKWQLGESLFSNLMGPIRSEVPLYWAAGDTDSTATVGPSTYFRMQTTPLAGEGYLRDDALEVPRGLYALDPDTGGCARLIVVSGVTTNTPVPDAIQPTDVTTPARIVTGSQNVPELAPVELNTTDPVSGDTRYHELTRDSGPVVRVQPDPDPDHGLAVDDPVNIGLYGHGPGMYVDNVNDLQFRGSDGQSNLSALMNDWLRSPTGQGYAGSATGWNATFTMYAPPGVEIEFFPSQAAVLATVTDRTLPTDDAPPTAAGRLWWPNHTAGAPGIKITRHDRRWRRGDYTGGAWHVGEDSGRNVIVIDYPAYPNQVIFAEGNVRVKGVLPARDRTTAGGPLDRSFDVTVVSNGTIYIDGQLMTTQDVVGRREGTNISNSMVLDENAAKVALLANDYVCLNPTQLVPQLTSGLVTAGADDEANPTTTAQHWELSPNTGGAVYSQWRWGWPDVDADNNGFGEGTPGTGVDLANVRVSVTPIHAGADPGPSGVGMTVYNENTPTTVPFPFTAVPGVLDPYTFIFVPPGAFLGTSITPEQVSNAIAPSWQVPGSTPPEAFGVPLVPFSITPYVSTSIGFLNAVSLFHRDPQVGTGSTAYLIKKWKIEETSGPVTYTHTDPATGATTPYEFRFPRPAVHAHVNALMMAQRGCWFVIPGTYFDANATTAPNYDEHFGGDKNTVSPLDSLYAARFRRYNYEIVVRGAITQDHTAPLEAQQTWTNRWAYPLYTGSGASLSLAWGTIRYEFDDRLRMARDQSLTTLIGTERRAASTPDNVQGLLPKLPCLPTSPTLIYAGGTL